MAKEVKQAKKVKTKAKINWGWDSPEDRDGKATRSSRRTSQRKLKTRKSLGFKAMLVILIVTLVGVSIGVGTCWALTRDDYFVIVGNDEITLTLRAEGEEINSRNSYIDEGIKAVSFGRDVSDKVYIKTDLKRNEDGSFTADEIGTYYIIYRVDDIKYDKIFTVQRIRLITFVESEEPDINVD